MISMFRQYLSVVLQPWLFALLFMVTIVAGCDGPPAPPSTFPVRIRVGYLPVSTTLPNWIAASHGYAKRYGIDIDFIRYANSDLLLIGLLNGDIDATSVCADEPILAAVDKGKSGFEVYLQEILTPDRVFDAIIVSTDSAIDSLKDLEGRTLACFPGNQLKKYAHIILNAAGVDADKVTIIQLPPANMLPSLSAGSVDACFALEPIITIGTARGVSRILEPSPIVRYIGNGESICAASFLISTAWADANPQAADDFVRSVYESISFIETNYIEASVVYPEFSAIPEDLAQSVAITRFATIDAPDLIGMQTEATVLHQAGILQTTPDVKSLFYRWRVEGLKSN